jgi:hypothetical protein
MASENPNFFNYSHFVFSSVALLILVLSNLFSYATPLIPQDAFAQDEPQLPNMLNNILISMTVTFITIITTPLI